MPVDLSCTFLVPDADDIKKYRILRLPMYTDYVLVRAPCMLLVISGTVYCTVSL